MSVSDRGQAVVQDGRVFHVVCRECSTESLARTRAVARELANRHKQRSNHRVVIERID
jgi:hypothetical protein